MLWGYQNDDSNPGTVYVACKKLLTCHSYTLGPDLCRSLLFSLWVAVVQGKLLERLETCYYYSKMVSDPLHTIPHSSTQQGLFSPLLTLDEFEMAERFCSACFCSFVQQIRKCLVIASSCLISMPQSWQEYSRTQTAALLRSYAE